MSPRPFRPGQGKVTCPPSSLSPRMCCSCCWSHPFPSPLLMSQFSYLCPQPWFLLLYQRVVELSSFKTDDRTSTTVVLSYQNLSKELFALVAKGAPHVFPSKWVQSNF